MRPIDGNAIKHRVLNIAEAWKEVGQDRDALLVKSVVEKIVDTQPTLTPPNEPLTWSELAEMEDQPVYIVEMGARRYWALVTRVGKDSADFVTVDDPDDYGAKKLYGESWVVYRRPPEGEEETKDEAD